MDNMTCMEIMCQKPYEMHYKDQSHLRSSSTYVNHKLKVMPSLSPARALKRLCTVTRSARPEIAGAIRTKAFSPTSFPFKDKNNRDF